MHAECSIIDDEKIGLRTRRKYHSSIQQLESEGFEFLGIMRTKHFWGLFPFTLGIGLSGSEVMTVHLTNVSWYHPLFRSADGETIAYPLGIATRFYTFFEDSFAQRTSSGPGSKRFIEHCGLNSEHTSSDIPNTWLYHLAFCEQQADAGKQPIVNESVDAFLQMQLAEDTLTERMVGVAMGWGPLAFGLWKVMQASSS